uniref:IFM1 protein n=1 Tax=Denticeps clupeoides TaxID=299321 RepID=A0AAY4CLJ4_9TELE
NPPPALPSSLSPWTGQLDNMQQNTQCLPMQSTTYVIQENRVSSPPPPSDHVIWSLFNFMYCNFFCLGLVAFCFSIKSRDRKVAMDLEGAQHYGATARCLNIVILCLAILTVVITIISAVVSMTN